MRRITGEEIGGFSPAGPYSFGTITNRPLLFTAGQVGNTPENEREVVPGGVEAETHQVMANLKRILGAAAVGFPNVMAARIYLTDMTNFKRVNELYASYFPDNVYPVRETIGAEELPLDAHVEISMIAELP